MSKESCYIHYLSFLKCIGMFAVIGIHVFANHVEQYLQYYSKFELYFSHFMKHSLQMWAVPIFVMVSGALFLNPERKMSLMKLYSKYILRFVVVLLTFGTGYALMELVFDAKAFNPRMLLTALKNVYSGELWDHMWFIYMIMGLYMIVPVLQKTIISIDDTLLKYFLSLIFIFACVFPTITKISGIKFGVYIPCPSIWLFYYCFGYAIHYEKIRISNKLSILFVSIGILWSITSYMLKIDGIEDIIRVLMTVGIFSLAKELCSKKINFVDTVINPITFGVYIIHALFVNVFYKVLHITPDKYNVFLMWSIVFIGTAFFSMLTVFILRKITFVKKFIL